LSCWRHRFHNQFDAVFWGPAYQCPRCGWWHIRFIKLQDVPWSRVTFWGAIAIIDLYILWILFNAFIGWNWP